MLVPNAALRWFPQPEQVAAKFRAMADSSAQRGAGMAGKPQSSEPAVKSAAKSHQGILWTQDGRYVRPIKVRVGLSDGTNTEVQGDDVKEGMEVIVGEQRQGSSDTGTTNPFAPQMMRSSR
jgi:HlyD family secretion protein